MKPKTLIIIIVLLVILFVAGVVIGANGGTGSSTTFSMKNLEAQGLSLLPKQWLAAKDIRSTTPAACSAQFTQGVFSITVGKSCQLIIRSSNASVRQLGLKSSPGPIARVDFDPYDNDQITASYDLTPQKTCKIVSIFKKGGSLTIKCESAAAGQCQVQVVQKDCPK